MATMTIEEFKRRWETDSPPIINDDCADCAVAWGLCRHPRIMPIRDVVLMVLKHVGVDPNVE